MEITVAAVSRVIEAISGIPVPAGRQVFTFPVADSPMVSPDPAQLNPFGFGPLASGGKTIQFQVALVQFAGAGDVYLAYSVSTDSVYFCGKTWSWPRLSGHLISGRSIGPIRSADGGCRTMGEKHERPFRCQPSYTSCCRSFSWHLHRISAGHSRGQTGFVLSRHGVFSYSIDGLFKKIKRDSIPLIPVQNVFGGGSEAEGLPFSHQIYLIAWVRKPGNLPGNDRLHKLFYYTVPGLADIFAYETQDGEKIVFLIIPAHKLQDVHPILCQLPGAFSFGQGCGDCLIPVLIINQISVIVKIDLYS